MEKQRSTADSSCMELNMTPMIDVIFQLLIFFMCSLHFKTLEGKLLSYLPKNGGIDPRWDNKYVPEIRVRLVYDEQVEGRARVFIGNRLCRDLGEMADTVSNAVADSRRAMQTVPDIKLDPDREIPCQAIVSALDELRRRNVNTVGFAAKEGLIAEGAH
jgi:biopolymer transport protein ExbD